LGLQVYLNPGSDILDLKVSQWEAYQEKEKQLSASDSLQALIRLLDRHHTDYLSASTQIIIAPGYTFRIVDGLITNFHQPQSTLLLLISAYLGDEWIRIYEHALANDYRFLSYGDSNLYLKS
jgi:S-adenosylmethionine:tRNA ribosyltransferase-isomerase